MRIDKRWWFLIVLLGLVVLFFALDLQRFLSLEAIKDGQADLEACRGHGIDSSEMME
jgi:hypothetical protein